MGRNLPYREKVEVFVACPGGRILCQDRESYLMFPGGGVDPGESKARTARREIAEETGAKVSELRHVTTVDWDWFPEWAAGSDTRKARYAQFRGERVHFYTARLAPGKEQYTGSEDSWKGRKTMPIEKALRLQKKYAAADHVNTRPYRVVQELVLYMLKTRDP